MVLFDSCCLLCPCLSLFPALFQSYLSYAVSACGWLVLAGTFFHPYQSDPLFSLVGEPAILFSLGQGFFLFGFLFCDGHSNIRAPRFFCSWLTPMSPGIQFLSPALIPPFSLFFAFGPSRGSLGSASQKVPFSSLSRQVLPLQSPSFQLPFLAGIEGRRLRSSERLLLA